MRHFVSFLVFCLSITLQGISQNLGINNTDPKVSLDITGALAHRAVTLNPAGNTLNIPANVSFIIIGTGATGPITLADPETLVNGRRLVVLNNSGFNAVFDNFTIADGSIREFVCSGPGSGWHLVTPTFTVLPAWLTTGNFGTNPDIDFLGTADDQELSLRTNSTERMRLTNEGLKIRNDLRLEFGYGIDGKPYGNGSIFYNTMGPNPSLDIYGAGNDMTGYDRRITFWANGGASFTGGANFNGSLTVNGEIKPGGNSGQPGQVLTSIGLEQMKWEYPEKTGQMIEVSPFTGDTGTLSMQGYQLMGEQTRTISKTTPSGGNLTPLVNLPQVSPESHVFHFAAQNRLYVVGNNTISSISLQDATYGNVTNYTVPAFNLNSTVPVFSGAKIFIYPFFSFDCATNTTSTFPSPPCGSMVSSTAQAWTGTFLVMYGPGGGIRYNPSTNAITCIETMAGNLYKPNSTATAAGSKVMFYGGYVLALGDTISFDGGLLYDPVANSWNDVAAGGPRIHSHQAVWTGTEVMFFGGRTDEARSEIGVNFYNPGTSAWNTGYTPGLAGFYTHKNTRSFMADNKVFVFNAVNSDVLPVTFLKSYFNLATKAWVSFTPLLRNGDERAEAASALVGTDIYYFPWETPCTGSVNYLHFFALETNDLFMYPRYNAVAISNSGQKMAASGNFVISFGQHGGGLTYQANRNRWIKAATSGQPTDREGHVCIPLTTNLFFVWGGKNGGTYLNTGGIYNASTNTWTTVSTSNAPSARANHAAAFGNGKVLIWGGDAGGAFLNNGKLYDVATNTWSNVSSSGAPACSAFTYLEWNGTDAFTTFCNQVYKYNPVANAWSFVYPDGKSTLQSSSGTEFQVGIYGNLGEIYRKSTNLHYKMDGNGLEFVVNKTQFINDEEVLLPGSHQAQLYHATQKNFKFTRLNYMFRENYLSPILFPGGSGNFLVMGVRPMVPTGCNYTDAIMLFQPNTGAPITKDISVKSLIYRKD